VNGFDVIVLGLAGALGVVGLWKGLTRILIGIAALVAAFLVAARFHETVAPRLPWLDEAGELRRLVAWAVLFCGVLLAGAIVAWIVRKLLAVAMLGWADRLAGAVLGIAAAVLVAALVALPVVAYAPSGEEMLRDSTLAPWVTVVADVARAAVPDGMAQRYRERIGHLRRHWADRFDP
jgi:membrane protein required for colicin V production